MLDPDAEIDIEFAKKRLALVAASAGVRKNLGRLVRALLRGRSV